MRVLIVTNISQYNFFSLMLEINCHVLMQLVKFLTKSLTYYAYDKCDWWYLWLIALMFH